MRWISEHNKVYNTVEEYTARFHRWLEVDAFVKEINHPDSGETHTAGHNKFSDWTEEEFSKMLSLDEPEVKQESNFVATPSNATSFDWRSASSCVNPVKDQGSCGSCWAFAATAVNESSYCIGGNALLNLSEQQYVDCSTAQGNLGCQGGWYWWAWDYSLNAGQELTSDYPYKAVD